MVAALNCFNITCHRTIHIAISVESVPIKKDFPLLCMYWGFIVKFGAKCQVCSHAVQQFESCMRKFQCFHLLQKCRVVTASAHESSVAQVHRIDKTKLRTLLLLWVLQLWSQTFNTAQSRDCVWGDFWHHNGIVTKIEVLYCQRKLKHEQVEEAGTPLVCNYVKVRYVVSLSRISKHGVVHSVRFGV